MKGESKAIMECKKIISQFKQKMPERTIENAIKLAKELIQTLNIKEYPVPIVSILKELGFAVFVTEMPRSNISGFIIIDSDLKEKFGTDKTIAIDNNDSLGRQRFTLAHEFAHYLFDFNENNETTFVNTYNLDKANENDEKIPSRFAAEFLMPEDMFRKRFEELSSMTHYERINQLVSDFNVTTKSIQKRFEELELK